MGNLVRNMGVQVGKIVFGNVAVIFYIRHTDEAQSRVFHGTVHEAVYQSQLGKRIGPYFLRKKFYCLFGKIQRILVVGLIGLIIQTVAGDGDVPGFFFQFAKRIG